MPPLFRLATFAPRLLLLLHFCIIFWQQFLMMSSCSAVLIPPQTKHEIGQLMLTQIRDFRQKFESEIEHLLEEQKKKRRNTTFLRKQYETIQKEIGKILIEEVWNKPRNEGFHSLAATAAKHGETLNPLPKTLEEEERDEFNHVWQAISKSKFQMLVLKTEAEQAGLVPIVANVKQKEQMQKSGSSSSSAINSIILTIDNKEKMEEEKDEVLLVEALAQFRSSTTELMDKLLVEIWLLQPAEEFAELGKQIEGQKQGIRKPIEDLVDTVVQETHPFAMNEIKILGKDHVLGFIPGIVKSNKEPLRKEFNELVEVLHEKGFKNLKSQDDGDEENLQLRNLIIAFDQLLARSNPFLSPLNEQISEPAKAETELPEEIAKRLEDIGSGINAALPKIHEEITNNIKETKKRHLLRGTKLAIGEEWVKEYDSLHALELLSSVSREMYRHLEAISWEEPNKLEQREKSLLTLEVLANGWLKPGLRNSAKKIDRQCIKAVKAYLKMGEYGELVGSIEVLGILTEDLKVRNIAASGQDLKVRIVLSAMHVLFLYKQLRRLHSSQNSKLFNHLAQSADNQPHPPLPSSAGSQVHLKDNVSLIEREVKNSVEMDVVQAQIGERLYQMFCNMSKKKTK